MYNLVDKVKDKVGGGSSGSSGGFKQGSKLPTGLLKENNPEKGSVDLSSLAGKTHRAQQAPGYIENAEAFAAKGIQGIYIIAVNDVFVTQAWKEHLHSQSPMVHFLADDTGAWTKEAGMNIDATGLLGNHRSQRYVAIVENGSVKQVFVEDEAPSVTVTKAENVLQYL